MSFAIVPATPYIDGVSKVSATSLNYARIALSQAIDATGGGSYTPSAQIVLGGAGLRLSGVTALELDNTSICTQDSAGVFNWNGTQNVGPLADVNFAGTDAFNLAFLNLNAWSEATFNANSFLIFNSDSAITVGNGTVTKVESTVTVGFGSGVLDIGDPAGSSGHGNLNVNADSFITVAGLSGHVAQAVIGANGILQIGTNTVTGAALQVWGNNTLSLLSGSILDVNSACVASIALGGVSSLISSVGSVVTLGGANTFSGINALSGPTTQTGSLAKSGNGAWTANRILALNAGSTTIAHPEASDLILLGENGADLNGSVYTLALPSGLPDGIRVVISADPVKAGATGTFAVAGVYNGTAQVNFAFATPLLTPTWVEVVTRTISGTQQWVVVSGANIASF